MYLTDTRVYPVFGKSAFMIEKSLLFQNTANEKNTAVCVEKSFLGMRSGMNRFLYLK